MTKRIPEEWNPNKHLIDVYFLRNARRGTRIDDRYADIINSNLIIVFIDISIKIIVKLWWNIVVSVCLLDVNFNVC